MAFHSSCPLNRPPTLIHIVAKLYLTHMNEYPGNHDIGSFIHVFDEEDDDDDNSQVQAWAGF